VHVKTHQPPTEGNFFDEHDTLKQSIVEVQHLHGVQL